MAYIRDLMVLLDCADKQQKSFKFMDNKPELYNSINNIVLATACKHTVIQKGQHGEFWSQRSNWQYQPSHTGQTDITPTSNRQKSPIWGRHQFQFLFGYANIGLFHVIPWQWAGNKLSSKSIMISWICQKWSLRWPVVSITNITLV